VDGDCVQLTGPKITQMQLYVFYFAKTGHAPAHIGDYPTPAEIANPVYPVKVGAIDIGDWNRVQPFMAPGLDFYGMDLYYGTSTLTQNPTNALNNWLTNACAGYGAVDSTGANTASISICECNLNISGDTLQQLDPLRAAYFYTAAKWVWGEPTQSTRSFLCFWDGSGTLGGNFVPGNNGVQQRASLEAIAIQDWSNPNGYPEPAYPVLP
jgi:hypothetical protein